MISLNEFSRYLADVEEHLRETESLSSNLTWPESLKVFFLVQIRASVIQSAGIIKFKYERKNEEDSPVVVRWFDTREERSAHACLPCFRREFACASPNRNYMRYQNKLDSGREIQKSKFHTQKISLEFHEHKVY